MGWTIQGPNLGSGSRFSSSPECSYRSDALPAFFSIGTGGSFPGVERRVVKINTSMVGETTKDP
jgi:hypothetical protein